MPISSSPRPVRKRRRGQVTTRKIVDAAITLLLTEGLEAVTTSRLAQASGIVQSGFYTHFRSVDEVIAQAAERIGQHLRRAIHNLQQELVALRGGTVAELHDHYLRILRLLLTQDREFSVLFVQYRRSPSPLGDSLRRFERSLIRDTARALAPMTHPAQPAAGQRDLAQAESLFNLFWVEMDLLLQGRASEAALDRAALHLAILSKVSVEFNYRDFDRARLLRRHDLNVIRAAKR